MPKKIIYADDVIDAFRNHVRGGHIILPYEYIKDIVLSLPSAQPEIIRCNVCRHWHQTTGEMKGFGLGDCDYLEKKLVTCNGYCYWAERKEDE